MITQTDKILLAWLGHSNVVAFLMFGYDKYCATRGNFRVSEYNLAFAGAIGGWIGAALAQACALAEILPRW